MTKLCFQNPVVRDGTSQQQRLVKALLPEFVSIDERGFLELKEFVLDFAAEIRFIFPDGTDADWVRFFERSAREDQNTDPDYALFQTFLELFKIAQGDLNTLTKRHLDFYYEDVLRLRGKAPIPDRAFITFQAAPHIEDTGSRIVQGTRLKAGKDDLGNNLFYATTREIVVNKGTVAEIKNLFREPQTSDLYESPVANSGDGLGGDFTNDALSWLPFGSADRGRKAEIGFAFASPILLMAEGTRIVRTCLQLTGLDDSKRTSLSQLPPAQWTEATKVYFSGEEEWISPSCDQFGLVTNDLMNLPEFRSVAESKVLEFINGAETWEDIAGVEPVEGRVYDSPFSGYGDQRRDYDIGRTVASRIISSRSDLPQQRYTSIQQLRAIDGIGVDKINDLIYSFCESAFHQTSFDPATDTLCIIRSLGRDQEAIVNYLQDNLLDPFKTDWPVMKVVLQNQITNTAGDGSQSVYPELIDLQITGATIDIEVQEVRNLIVQNDQTVMDPAKIMQPFGLQPALGSNFFIGSQEVFKKGLTRLDVGLKWHKLPGRGFGNHYEYYFVTEDGTATGTPVPGLVERTNDGFKVDIELLQGKQWRSIDGEQNLFEFTNDDPVEDKTTFSLPVQEGFFNRDVDLSEIESYDNGTQQGFARLALTGTDFGHSDFQFVFTKQVLLNAEQLATAKIPKEPYTPELKEVYLNYASSVSFDLRDTSADEVEQFFHLTPFGASQQGRGTTRNLLPQYRNEGECYIGIDGLNPPQNITLLIQLLEGSEDPDVGRSEVLWSYLSNEGWVDFENPDVLSDSTNGLLTSGIAELSVPKKATKTDHRIKSGLHWLRVSVVSGSRAIPDFVAVVAQAVTVEFQDNNNDPFYLAQALPKETIKKLEFSDSSIKKLKQPFASFGGKIREENTPFYRRISERLRHKQRAVAIWDYERLVLHEFPFLYKAKCLNHTKYSAEDGSFSDLAPGHVTIIAVSNVQNLNGVNPFQPKTSLNKLESIKSFLKKYMTPAVTLHVRNPRYETVRVECKVRFKTGLDVGFYTRELEDAIKSFLSPWAYADGEEIVFGGRIHKSTIIDFIDERSYVEFVTCLNLYQNKNPNDSSSTAELVEEALASTSASILCSTGRIDNYGDHLIEQAIADCGNCEDNIVYPPPVNLAADSCESNDVDPTPEDDDPYGFRLPNLDLCPEPEQVDDCEEEQPSSSDAECVLKDPDQAEFFDVIDGKAVPARLDVVYLLPQSTFRKVNIEVIEVIDERTVRVAGLQQSLTHLEVPGKVLDNPSVYLIDDEVFELNTTRLNITNRDHKIEAGDRVNLFRPSQLTLTELYLPHVSPEMVAEEARLRFQVVAGRGIGLQIRPADFDGLDRLRMLNAEPTDTKFLALEVGSALKTYSVELQATAFDPLEGYNDRGWRVLNENINYFEACRQAGDTLEWDDRMML